jgi:antitoxin CptB
LPTGPSLSSADLPPERKKLLFRAWHRGMREMDLLMGQFAEARLAAMSEAELGEFNALLEAPDPDVLSWLTGQSPVPAAHDTATFRALKAFHTHSKPLFS